MGYYTIRVSPASQDMTRIVTDFGNLAASVYLWEYVLLEIYFKPKWMSYSVISRNKKCISKRIARKIT